MNRLLQHQKIEQIMKKMYAIFIELYMKEDPFVSQEITHIKRFCFNQSRKCANR